MRSNKQTDTDPRNSANVRRVVTGAAGGTIIEFYDFSIYGYLAVVMSPLFFPFESKVTSLLASLAVFGTAYFMRPLGSIVFGHIGDRRGRKTALLATLVCMGAASTAMGLLPTYDSIGVFAPILLVLVRLLQGFSAGGENGGAATFVSEVAPPHRRASFGAVIGIGGNIGFASAAAVAGIVTLATTTDQMDSWGWRIPFLLSLPLTLFCFWIRRNMADTLDRKDDSAPERSPLVELLRTQRASVMQVAGLSIAVNGTSYFGFTYLSIHLIERLGYDSASVYWVATGVIAISGILMVATGRLADRIGVVPVAGIGLLGYVVLVYPAMAIMGGNLALATLGFFAIMINTAFLQVAVFTIAPRLFVPEHRYTGVAVSYNVGVMVAGGSAPFVSVLLIEQTGNVLSPAFFVIGVAVIGICTLWTLRNRFSSETTDAVETQARLDGISGS